MENRNIGIWLCPQCGRGVPSGDICRDCLDNAPAKTERYKHHGIEVAVQSHLKGKHREYCLCFQGCAKFPEGGSHTQLADCIAKQLQGTADYIRQMHPEQCPRATILFAFCRAFGMTTPVFECPEHETVTD